MNPPIAAATSKINKRDEMWTIDKAPSGGGGSVGDVSSIVAQVR